MQANWSLILNVLLLIGVVAAISCLVRSRRKNFMPINYEPPILGPIDTFDDIIAVRKINCEPEEPESAFVEQSSVAPSRIDFITESITESPYQTGVKFEEGKSLMMFLLAKENRQLAGYELLQTILAAGLRFGEGNLFHRHQHANGQGTILCSLAAATASGVFDLQNMGAFSVRGLCLFMQASGNPSIDGERFAIMHETAKQLRDGLDAHLLDDQRRPLSSRSLARYYSALNINEPQELSALA